MADTQYLISKKYNTLQLICLNYLTPFHMLLYMNLYTAIATFTDYLKVYFIRLPDI
jgi:hypothetical protein